tara:strand:- start:100 stop:699 length:600 start_codon:yes stop_codon:yes gene_type:complete
MLRFLFSLEAITAALPLRQMANLHLVDASASHVVLSLPEAATRRRRFESLKSSNLIAETNIEDGFYVFNAIKITPNELPKWYGTAVSYKTIAQLATSAGLQEFTIVEDDVQLKENHQLNVSKVRQLLHSQELEWDIFVGLMADVRDDTQVLDTFEFDGPKLILVNRMPSMVYNICSHKTLKLLTEWELYSLDAFVGTVD